MRRRDRLRGRGPVQGTVTEQALAQQHLRRLRVLQDLRLHGCTRMRLWLLNGLADNTLEQHSLAQSTAEGGMVKRSAAKMLLAPPQREPLPPGMRTNAG